MTHVQDLLAESRDELNYVQRTEVQQHLAQCPACEALRRELERNDALLARQEEKVAIPAFTAVRAPRSSALPLLALSVAAVALLLFLFPLLAKPHLVEPAKPLPTAPSATAQPSPSPAGTLLRLTDGAAPEGRPVLLFQVPGETRLRAVAWDASSNGVLQAEVPANALWSQSPDGSRYLADGKVYARDGVLIGSLSRVGKASTASWSRDGRLLCAAVPETTVTGARMLLETAAPGQPARVVASGYDVFSDNAVYSVLACDPASDRAIVAVFGQGVAPSRLWVFRLSNGALMRSIDYRGSNPVRWVTASSDGAMLAESTRDAAGQLTTTVRATDTGATLGTVDGLDAQGFSGDGSLLVGVTAAMTPALVEWKTGRLVWSMGAVAYGGSVAEPGGSRLAITLDDPGYTAVRSVVIVAPDGTAVYLPDRSRVR